MAEAPSIPSSSSSIRPSRIKITTAGLPSKSSTNGWKGRGPSPNNRQQQRLKSQETIMASTDHLTDEEFVTRSEEHTSELQSLMRISYAVFSLKKNQHISTTRETKYKTATHNSTMMLPT